jgi:uncharacterized protein (TIGR02246 family)
MRAFATVAVLLLVAACQTAPPPMEFTAGDRAAIDELGAAYLATALAGDWDAWTALWTEDGVYMVPDAPRLVGHADIRASLDAFPAPPAEMSVTLNDVDGAGKWAWARGSFLFAMDAAEEMPEMRLEGSFLWVLEKQADGRWLIDSECYNSDFPPPPPPEET